VTRRIRAPILVFSRGDAAIASDPLGAYWVLSQLALCSPPLGEAFHIANVAQSGDDSPKVVVASRVDPAGEKDAYKITFSEPGWPPAYSGQTSLAIRPQDRRVLRLPAMERPNEMLAELS
jgi:hypothetical protein